MKEQIQNQFCRKEHFTLIELLVVVAIIASLAGMLLPVLGKVKKTAYKASCSGNLKQTGMLASSYENDFGALPTGYQPASDNATAHGRATGWYHLLYSTPRENDSIAWKDITPISKWKPLWCPADTEPWVAVNPSGKIRLTYVGNANVLANWSISDSDFSPNILKGGTTAAAYGGLLGLLRLTPKSPSRIGMIFELPRDGQYCGPTTNAFNKSYYAPTSATSEIPRGTLKDPTRLHSSGCNVLMCDGHIAFVNPYKIAKFDHKYFYAGKDAIRSY